jgi:hypothetical protein
MTSGGPGGLFAQIAQYGVTCTRHKISHESLAGVWAEVLVFQGGKGPARALMMNT